MGRHGPLPFLASLMLCLIAVDAVTLITFEESLNMTTLVCEWSGKSIFCRGYCDPSTGAQSYLKENWLQSWMLTYEDAHVMRNETGRPYALSWHFGTEFGLPCLTGHKQFCCWEQQIWGTRKVPKPWRKLYTGHFYVAVDEDGIMRSRQVEVPWRQRWHNDHISKFEHAQAREDTILQV